jgi:hypothetical protein
MLLQTQAHHLPWRQRSAFRRNIATWGFKERERVKRVGLTRGRTRTSRLSITADAAAECYMRAALLAGG